MKKEELAYLLDGAEYPLEIKEEYVKIAKEYDFVVVYGSSDDNCCFEGSICDEFGCYDGGECIIDKDGIINPWCPKILRIVSQGREGKYFGSVTIL